MVFRWDCWRLKNSKSGNGDNFVQVPDIEGSFRDLEAFKRVTRTIWEAHKNDMGSNSWS